MDGIDQTGGAGLMSRYEGPFAVPNHCAASVVKPHSGVEVQVRGRIDVVQTRT